MDLASESASEIIISKLAGCRFVHMGNVLAGTVHNGRSK